MMPHRPLTTAKTPTFSSGSLLEDDLRRRLGARRDVPAEEARVADLHQRVIDLEVEDVLHAAGP